MPSEKSQGSGKDKDKNKNKYRKTYQISIWVNSGIGTYDTNLLTTFQKEFQVGPSPQFSEGSVDRYLDYIADFGYIFISESGAKTKYPAHRIDKIEAVEIED